MSAKRKALFPPPAHMTQSEAIEYLRRQVFEDASSSGWLKPCARKEGSTMHQAREAQLPSR